MYKVFLAITIACVFEAPVQAQVYRLGSCPSATVISNLNTTQYLGTWYENRNYFTFFEIGQRCIKATYSSNSDGTIGVLNEAVGLFGRKVSVTGKARQLSAPNGKLGVTFNNIPFSPTDAPYWILDTDYTSYSVVWSCSQSGILNGQIAWILTRNRNPDNSVINTALQVLDRNGISRSFLSTTDQNNCSN